MDPLPSDVRELARRLILIEETRAPHPDGHAGGAGRVCEALRALLSRFMGVAAFRSLLSRALALARAEAPTLGAVRVAADGSLEGLDEPGPGGDPGAADDGGLALVARLLGLLVVFIGPSLTLQLVRDGWPDARLDEGDSNTRGTP
jgi:hypothetical protein